MLHREWLGREEHHDGLIERRATSVHEQDIDGVLANHAEDMVM
jgi:hypothetical protein